MIDFSAFADFLRSRGTKLRPPAPDRQIYQAAKLLNCGLNYPLFELYQIFDGFSDDFDAKTMLRIWPLKEVVDASLAMTLPGALIPFADFSFCTDVYCLGRDDEGGHIWSEMKNQALGQTLQSFVAEWMQGTYDEAIGID